MRFIKLSLPPVTDCFDSDTTALGSKEGRRPLVTSSALAGRSRQWKGRSERQRTEVAANQVCAKEARAAPGTKKRCPRGHLLSIL